MNYKTFLKRERMKGAGVEKEGKKEKKTQPLPWNII